MRITGKVVKVELGMGFWGIEGDDGQEYRPVLMPEQLKIVGEKIVIHAIKVEDAPSIFMWGTPIEITQFET